MVLVVSSASSIMTPHPAGSARAPAPFQRSHRRCCCGTANHHSTFPVVTLCLLLGMSVVQLRLTLLQHVTEQQEMDSYHYYYHNYYQQHHHHQQNINLRLDPATTARPTPTTQTLELGGDSMDHSRGEISTPLAVPNSSDSDSSRARPTEGVPSEPLPLVNTSNDTVDDNDDNEDEVWDTAYVVSRSQMADSHDLYDDHGTTPTTSSPQLQQLLQSHYPRVIGLRHAFATTDDSQRVVVLTTYRSVVPLSQQTNAALEEEEDTILYPPFERPFLEECVPMTAWQSQSFPTCNTLHEHSVSDGIRAADTNTTNNTTTTSGILSLLSTDGSWRSVWKLVQQQPQQQHTQVAPPVVLKLLRYPQRSFDSWSYEHHRIDALAMERLTRSPYIVDIFAFCGQSVVTEMATGSARTLVKNENLHSLERLEIGRDMAMALADVHSIDYNDNNDDNNDDNGIVNATLVHNDMNMANVVEVNGRIKLNDFNIAILQRWNTTSQSVCRAPVRFAAPLWKSPEENRNTSYVDATATDVYGLGNLLFHVLTKRQPWTHLEPDGPLLPLTAAQRKMDGILPFVPHKYTASGNHKPALQALYHVTMDCFRLDPAARPTARSIAHRLDQLVQKLRHDKS